MFLLISSASGFGADCVMHIIEWPDNLIIDNKLEVGDKKKKKKNFSSSA